MEGPDGQYVLKEEEYVHVQSGLDDLRDHMELQQYIVEMDMRIESLEFDELDEILKIGLEQEDRKRMVLEVEGVRMDLSVEDWEVEVNTIDFEEWLVFELSEMYSPQLVTETLGK